MSELKKVYIVTEGEYSDYHICGVYEDKGVAEIVAKHMEGNVDEWELGKQIPPLYTHQCLMWLDASEEHYTIHECKEVHDSTVRRGVVWGYGFSPEQALKNASDARAKRLAEEAGI